MASIMSTTAVDLDEAVSYFSQMPSGVIDPERPSLVRDLKVFRTGSFRDGRGRPHSFDAADLDKMVENFQELRSNGAFPNVPVRADHSQSVNSIVGYFEGLRREDDFLLADVDFTEPEALKKFERKTYRGRSLEVAPYRTNDERLFQPCVLGLAFVDLPAVEGLYSRERMAPEPITRSNSVSEEKNEPMTFRIKGVETSDASSIQAHIDELEARPAPTDPVTFRLGGVETQDADEVQNYIKVLETFRENVAETARTEFVKNLAEDGKIAATQIEPMTAFAKDLDDDGFKKFQMSYEGAPSGALFGEHGQNGEGKPKPPNSDAATEKEILEATVAQFRFAGWDDEKVSQTAAAKRLAALASK